jgi:N-acyl-D-aspartate/D-glutamate deacylase
VAVIVGGGTIVDGSGARGFVGDVAVRDGRIVAAGPDAATAVAGERVTRIDASGLVVAPGFVDVHTHYDAQLLWDPLATPSPFHGVTTVIGGNCGFSLAPCGPEHADYLRRMMARVEGMPLAALEAGVDWSWTSFADYLERLDGAIGVNAGFLCGHSALRRTAMADRAVGEPATADDLARMGSLLGDALRAGALGWSTSQAHTHNDGSGDPVPSRHASRDEVLALAEVVAAHDGTTVELILAGCINGFTDDEVALMTDVSVTSGRPVNWNVLGVSSLNPTGHERQLEASDRAAAGGGTVVALTLPHPTSIRLNFLTGFVLDGLPGWADVLHLPVDQRLRALADPDVRRRLDAGAQSDEAGMLRGLANWRILTLAETFAPQNRALTGRTVGDVATEQGRDPFDVLCDVVVADGLRTGLRPPVFGNSDADWALRASVWHDPRTVVGGSDAGAHLDMMCGAVYSSTLLAEGVRERQLLTLEAAVHQLTERPARLYGLRDRGRIEVGAVADLVIFDAARVGHGPEHTRADLPGGSWRLYADGVGFEHVLVGGVPIISGGVATGSTPGRVLRSGTDTVTVPAGTRWW